MTNTLSFQQIRLLITSYLSVKNITSTVWLQNLGLRQMVTLPTRLQRSLKRRSSAITNQWFVPLVLPSQTNPAIFPFFCWIPKLHKSPYKQRFIAGSANCTTKPLSKLLTSILSAIKSGLQKYCDACYSTSGVNQMWILKNSKDLMDILRSRSLSKCDCIKTFDFSTLYTTIPHQQLKTRLETLIRRCFFKTDGKRRYK